MSAMIFSLALLVSVFLLIKLWWIPANQKSQQTMVELKESVDGIKKTIAESVDEVMEQDIFISLETNAVTSKNGSVNKTSFQGAHVLSLPFHQLLQGIFETIETVQTLRSGHLTTRKLLKAVLNDTEVYICLLEYTQADIELVAALPDTKSAIEDYTTESGIQLCTQIDVITKTDQCDMVCDTSVFSAIAYAMKSCGVFLDYSKGKSQNEIYRHYPLKSPQGWYLNSANMKIMLWPEDMVQYAYGDVTVSFDRAKYVTDATKASKAFEVAVGAGKHVILKGKAGTGKTSFAQTGIKALLDDDKIERVIYTDGATVKSMLEDAEMNLLTQLEKTVVFIDEANGLVSDANAVGMLKAVTTNIGGPSFIFCIDDVKLSPEFERVGRIGLHIGFEPMKGNIQVRLNALQKFLPEKVLDTDSYNLLKTLPEYTIADLVGCLKDKEFESILEELIAERKANSLPPGPKQVHVVKVKGELPSLV